MQQHLSRKLVPNLYKQHSKANHSRACYFYSVTSTLAWLSRYTNLRFPFKTYPGTKNELSRSWISKVTVWHTNRQTGKQTNARKNTQQVMKKYGVATKTKTATRRRRRVTVTTWRNSHTRHAGSGRSVEWRTRIKHLLLLVQHIAQWSAVCQSYVPPT